MYYTVGEKENGSGGVLGNFLFGAIVLTSAASQCTILNCVGESLTPHELQNGNNTFPDLKKRCRTFERETLPARDVLN